MDNEKELFKKGCFLPNWTEVDTKDEMPISKAYETKFKDLNTLLGELAQIKQHIEDVREREWRIARMIHFHDNNFVKE